ncbi:hypothetical protein H5410_026219 [Solanum commersonii]|uniref:Uncharacterized protein n=1 Tax=Solanum commersonii TaxID=4109 RepID=A0A9J5YYB8_SOLCO|nr:hypothetical protein H5410_026219 [Solanum commersonii]
MFPNTYYFSYATKRTRKVVGITVPSGILGIHPLLFIKILQMSLWRHPPNVPPPYKGYNSAFWLPNNNFYTNIRMRIGGTMMVHSTLIYDTYLYYKIVECEHILFIVNRERAGVQFNLIYDSIFERCRKHAIRKNLTMPNHII